MLVNQVDYRTGRNRDLVAVTERAHSVGRLAVWDLCHSAGVMEVGLNAAGADMAVGAATSISMAGLGRRLSCSRRGGIWTGSVSRCRAGGGMRRHSASIRNTRPTRGFGSSCAGRSHPVVPGDEAGAGDVRRLRITDIRAKSMALTDGSSGWRGDLRGLGSG